MRVVLTKPMVVGHVMRYPGEVVEVPDDVDTSTPEPIATSDTVEAPKRKRANVQRANVPTEAE